MGAVPARVASGHPLWVMSASACPPPRTDPVPGRDFWRLLARLSKRAAAGRAKWRRQSPTFYCLAWATARSAEEEHSRKRARTCRPAAVASCCSTLTSWFSGRGRSIAAKRRCWKLKCKSNGLGSYAFRLNSIRVRHLPPHCRFSSSHRPVLLIPSLPGYCDFELDPPLQSVCVHTKRSMS